MSLEIDISIDTSGKDLDLRKILVTPKIFLKSRVNCTIAGINPMDIKAKISNYANQKYPKNIAKNHTNRTKKWIVIIDFLQNSVLGQCHFWTHQLTKR